MLLRKIVCSFLLTQLGLVGAAKIKFYDSLNCTGLFHEYNGSPSSCTQLPVYGHGKLVSIISDTCIILYEQTSCNSFNSIRLDSGQHDNLKNKGFGTAFNSFKTCSVSEGGESLNVDLYYTTDLNDLAVQYYGVCGCIRMPTFVGTRQIMSIDNHGNCVKLYEGTDCTGKTIELPGGSNAKTRNLGLYFGVPTRSISSCDDHFACLQLEANIFKFELTSMMSKGSILENSLDFELAAKTTLKNNGSAVVTQEYQASKKIIESVEISRSNSLSEMTRVYTEKETEWGVSAGLSYGPFSSSGSFKKRMFEAHTMEQNSSHQESEKYFAQDEREFSVSQTIQILPCTLYEVSSVVRFAEKFPVEYVLHARISGSYAGLRMTAANLKDRLTSMEYVGDHDDFTIIAKTTGSMNVDFGVETVIDGEGVPIAGCQV